MMQRPRRQYHVEPFQPAISERLASRTHAIAAQLEELTNRAAMDGWIFQGCETIPVTVNGGCWPFARSYQQTYHVAVFYRDVA